MKQFIKLYIITAVMAFSLTACAAPSSPPVPSEKKTNSDLFEGYSMSHSHSGANYEHWSFDDSIDIKELRKQKGKIYSNPDEIRAVLAGGVKTDMENGKSLWKEGLMFDGIEPMPHMVSAANWYPRTEDVLPNEMRITFMGTSPMIRPAQMNTSIYVELGNGSNFIFDIGEGSVANYVAAGVALNEMDTIFITHLHVDHFGSLPYIYEFGGWNGRWEKPLTVYGPSGASPEYGTKAMVEGMLNMLAWHTDAFDVFPAGNAIDVVEFDFKDDGGIIYDKDNIKIIHWRRSHAKDGASGYRLDWKISDTESLCFVWTGDGRPTELDIKYAKGCDIFVTELQTETFGVSSIVQGVPPFLARYTVDTHHTPAYASGYLASKIKPRLFMTTHMAYDPYLNEETVAEVRVHWKGPFHFGAPDGIVVNVTPDKIWVREGILPDHPNSRAPQFDMRDGSDFRVPMPKKQRVDIQQKEIRDLELDPKLYYPKGYHPVLMQEWPVDRDIVIPAAQVPEAMKKGMNTKQEYMDKARKAHGLPSKSVTRSSDDDK
ncbi:MAG: MBL fold metallo-hydrolase [Gammaproteobacteria bacterium]|nr:MAG: MBL fold metallo-hydrolase [Gammaproteobacteria bacterium]